MPPGRRGRPPGSTSTPKNPQQRLSFGPNASNKITKPSPLSQSQTKKLSPPQKAALSVAATDGLTDSAPETPAADHPAAPEDEERALPIRRNQREAKAAEQESEKRDKKETEALTISEAQIKKYWKLKNDARIAPRVHQKGLGVHEKVLREFDLSSQFGPCIGIPRMKRWKRADGLGLKPPMEVLAVLLKEEGAGHGMERAYVDQLMGNHLGSVDG